MRNRRRPKYGEPEIVMENLSQAVYDTENTSAASMSFREPLDIALGIIDEDGDFLIYHFDSRRFELY
jgi:hypothetical protein